MKLKAVRFVDGASVENNGLETEWLQNFDAGNSRTYAGDLRLEDGFIRWGARFAPMQNARQMEAVVEEPAKVAAVGGKRR